MQVRIALFVVASLVGGLGVNTAMLTGARAVQGVGAALATSTSVRLSVLGCPSVNGDVPVGALMDAFPGRFMVYPTTGVCAPMIR